MDEQSGGGVAEPEHMTECAEAASPSLFDVFGRGLEHLKGFKRDSRLREWLKKRRQAEGAADDDAVYSHLQEAIECRRLDIRIELPVGDHERVAPLLHRVLDTPQELDVHQVLNVRKKHTKCPSLR